MIKAVVWDIGNVFAIWDPETYYDGKIGVERRMAFFAETNPHVMNEALDLGTPGHELTRAHAENHPDWRDEIHLWFDGWEDMFRERVEGSAEIMNELRAVGVRQLALSNFGFETLVLAKEMHPALKGFDEEYVSGHLGLAKPDPAIYQALETGANLTGDALIFADDREDNIAAAAARGWKTHLFNDAAGWRARLVGEGLLS